MLLAARLGPRWLLSSALPALRVMLMQGGILDVDAALTAAAQLVADLQNGGPSAPPRCVAGSRRVLLPSQCAARCCTGMCMARVGRLSTTCH